MKPYPDREESRQRLREFFQVVLRLDRADRIVNCPFDFVGRLLDVLLVNCPLYFVGSLLHILFDGLRGEVR